MNLISLRRSAAFLLVVLGSAACVNLVYGQEFASKPIRMLSSAVGSSGEAVGRLIAPVLASRLGQPGVVENRGILAPELAAKAAPDGHTIVIYSTPLWVSPFLRDNVPWDPIRDFAPITLAVDTPNILVVHPSVPVKTTKELIALAKRRPGALNYGSGSSGSTSHLAAELFNAMANVKITRIPYKGVGPAGIGLAGGEIDLIFSSGSTIASQVNAGRLRALAVATLKPSLLYPGLPTVSASGVPGYEAGTPVGIFAPAGTPPAIVSRLNQAIVGALNMDDTRKRVFDIGAEVVGSSPGEFSAYLKSDMAKWGKLIKEKGIRE